MREYCFVIQPFDKGKFDKRFTDVFKPSIERCNVDAYRVDNDYSVDIPIEAIEERIKNSRFCLADITTDNPNVWYEVGFAIAINKDVILICSDERTAKYPFDIQHRSIISYRSESPSDFSKLQDLIIKRTHAILSKTVFTQSSINVNLNAAGLDFKEITFIGAILHNQGSPNESVSAWSIQNDMKKSGLNEIAFNLASRKLISKQLISVNVESDYNGNECSVYSLTEAGDAWVLENEDKFDMTLSSITDTPTNQDEEEDTLPF